MASCGNLRYGGVVLTHIFCGHDPDIKKEENRIMEKRILSVCLTACMLLTLMPSAFAADAEQPLPIAGMEQTEETSADARTEPGDEPQEPVPTEEGKGTQEEPFTTVAAYNEAVKGDALDGKDVYLTISRTEFKEEQFALTNVQTRPNPPDCT